MSTIIPLKNIKKKDSAIVGGKGASLGRMTKGGFPVPDGFVITTQVFNKFLDENELNLKINKTLSSVDLNKIHTVELASKKIQKLISNCKISNNNVKEITSFFDNLGVKFVAVRSSATVEDGFEDAWAGQLNTFLNITKKNLINRIKDCWKSLFTPRAIVYRFEKNQQKKQISVAVVIQAMINGDKSGVAFSTHPISKNPKEILIEAGFGLGEAVVSGEITPDNYSIDKKTKNLITSSINHQKRKLIKGDDEKLVWKNIIKESFPVLSENELVELTTYIKRIEKFYGFPVDIEWAKLKNKFFITQSRPITTPILKNKKKYSSIMEHFLELVNGEDIFQCMDTNIFPETVVWTKRSFLKKNYITKTPLPFIILMKGNQSVAYYQEKIWNDIGQEFTHLYFKKNSKAKKAINLFYSNKKSMDKLYKKYTAKYIKKEPFSKLKDLMPHLMELMEPKFFSDTSKEFCKQFLVNSTNKEIDELWEKGTIPICESFDTRQKRIVYEEILKGKNVLKSAEDFQYFYTGLTTVLNIKETKSSLSRNYSISKEEAKKRLKNLKEESRHEEFDNWYGNLNEKQKFMVDFIQLMIELRDLRKDIHTKGITIFYRIAKAHILEPLNIPEKYLQYISYNELLKPLSYFKKQKKEILLRKKGVALLVTNEGNSYSEKINFGAIKKALDRYIDRKLSKQEQITGMVASPGFVMGKVRVVTSIKKQEDEFKNGEILVTGMTRPEYLPLARKASAIITDEGGITSHAAIIARELKKPCIVGTNNATRQLKTGDLVTVDANLGIVKKTN